MERNTLTTLGLLTVGDRFTFAGKREVYEVTGKRKEVILYNGCKDGAPVTLFDSFKNAATQVRFLRRTSQEVKP